MRKILAPLAIAAAIAAPAVPAHAEQVDIGVVVGNDFSATAYGTSTHPGETFGQFQVVRVSATDSLADPHLTVGADGDGTMDGFDGSTTGAATFVVNAHPFDGDEPSPFVFTSVVVCTKLSGTVSCLPGAGLHTVISALPFN